MSKHRRFSSLSILIKFMLVFLLTSVLVIVVNSVMFYNINRSIDKVDEVYKSNVRMNEFTDALSNVDHYLKEYLETKSYSSIDQYYRNSQKLSTYMDEMEQVKSDEDSMMMQKNISNLTEHYLMITAEGIQAKRGRNVEKYRNAYNQSKKEYDYINTFIYSLNNEQFQVNSKNYDALTKTLHSLEMLCASMLICVSVADLVLIYILTRRITKPLISLAKAANEVGSGNLPVPVVEVSAMDEVGIVATAFNQMTLRLQDYIRQIREGMEKENAHKEKELLMESHLKDAKLKYLQAQINPHFLFNTLNAGVQLAMMEGADTTSIFIEHLADFFRYNLRKTEEDTTLEEELKLVDHYLYLLNVRFSGEIHYEKIVDEKYVTICVPSMILQPIIENAVNHGIRGMEGKGKITLHVYRSDIFVAISIKDNGIGMSEETIQNILSMKEVAHKKNDSNGIGIINVIKRLNLYYHDQNVIEINSKGEGLGTEIIIYVPI